MHFLRPATACLLLLTLLAVTGCATAPKTPDGYAEVAAFMQQWKQAIFANDINRIMALYSDQFTSEFGDKAAITEIMADLAQKMDDQDGRLNLEDADIAVSGDKASVKPISIGTRKGAVCRSVYLQKKDGRWLIVEMGRK